VRGLLLLACLGVGPAHAQFVQEGEVFAAANLARAAAAMIGGRTPAEIAYQRAVIECDDVFALETRGASLKWELSRTQEIEADMISVPLSARAGYDPLGYATSWWT